MPLQLHNQHSNVSIHHNALEYLAFESEDSHYFLTLKRVIPSVLIPLGVAENILSIVILCRNRFQGMPSRRTLITLSCIDIIVLLVGLLRYWIHAWFDIYLNLINPLACKTLSFLVFYTSHMSSFCVASVSMERMIAVRFPHSSLRSYWERYNLLAISLLILLVNAHLIFTTNFRTEPSPGDNNRSDPINATFCESNSEEVAFTVDIFDMLFLSFLPFIIICTCNVLIISKLFTISRRLQASQYSPSTTIHLKTVVRRSDPLEKAASLEQRISLCDSPTVIVSRRSTNNQQMTVCLFCDDGATVALKDSPSLIDGNTSINTNTTSNNNNNNNNNKHKIPENWRSLCKRLSRRDAHVTKMLLLVTLAFLICNLPFAIIHPIRTYTVAEANQASKSLELVWLIAYFMVYANNCLNFPIYFISQPLFRQQIRQILQHSCSTRR